MTYQKIKEILVEERNDISSRKLKGLLVRLFLSVFGLAISIGVVTFSTLGKLGLGITILVFIISFVVFNSLTDLCIEDPKYIKKVSIFSRFWLIYYILFVLIVFILHYFNFI